MKTTDFVKVNGAYGIVREQRMQGDYKIEGPDGSIFYAFPEQCEVITENEYLRGAGKKLPSYRQIILDFCSRSEANSHRYDCLAQFMTDAEVSTFIMAHGFQPSEVEDGFKLGDIVWFRPSYTVKPLHCEVIEIHPEFLTLRHAGGYSYGVPFDRVSKTAVINPELGTTPIQSFTEAAKPLMQWLRENEHPHVKAIVTGERADLLEEKLGILNNKL